MNYLQWLMFGLFFTMGFGAGYLRGIEVGKVIGYRRWRSVSSHVSNQTLNITKHTKAMPTRTGSGE